MAQGLLLLEQSESGESCTVTQLITFFLYFDGRLGERERDRENEREGGGLVRR